MSREPILPGYSKTPLPQKLGIKGGTTVALIDAPEGFLKTLGELPDDVTLSATARKPDLTLWFVRSRAEHKKKLAKIVKLTEHGHVWTIWPKLSSSLAGDISETYVRNEGLRVGLVDYKVCAVDDTWSGLKFARRKTVSREP